MMRTKLYNRIISGISSFVMLTSMINASIIVTAEPDNNDDSGYTFEYKDDKLNLSVRVPDDTKFTLEGNEVSKEDIVVKASSLDAGLLEDTDISADGYDVSLFYISFETIGGYSVDTDCTETVVNYEFYTPYNCNVDDIKIYTADNYNISNYNEIEASGYNSVDNYIYNVTFTITDVSNYIYMLMPTKTNLNDNNDNTSEEQSIGTLRSNSFIKAGDPSVLLQISNFSLTLTSGVNESYDFGADGVQEGWNADTSKSEHSFTYNISFSFNSRQSNYDTVTNTFVDEIPVGAIRIHIPLHIFGDGLDELHIWYPEAGSGDISDTVDYEWIANGDEIILYNRRPFDEARTIQVPISYKLLKETFNYTDMELSNPCKVELELDTDDGNGNSIFSTTGNNPYVIINGNRAETAEIPVYINTTARINNVKKSVLHNGSWPASWGEAPVDADNYYYVLWEVKSEMSAPLTQYYDFNLEDTYLGIVSCDGMPYVGDNGTPEIVGYRLSGVKYGESAGKYYDTTAVSTHQNKANRTDYVLTRYDNNIINNLDFGDYIMENDITGTVHPEDNIDADTSADSNAILLLEIDDTDILYKMPKDRYDISKSGLIGSTSNHVQTSKDVSSYNLEGLLEGTKVRGFRYEIDSELNGYIRTLSDGTATALGNTGGTIAIGDTIVSDDGYSKEIENGTVINVNGHQVEFLNSKKFLASNFEPGTVLNIGSSNYLIADTQTNIGINIGDQVTFNGVTYVVTEIPSGGVTFSSVYKGYDIADENQTEVQLSLRNGTRWNGYIITGGRNRVTLRMGDSVTYPSNTSISGMANRTVTIVNDTDVPFASGNVVKFIDTYVVTPGSNVNIIAGDETDVYQFGKQSVTYTITDRDVAIGNQTGSLQDLDANNDNYVVKNISYDIKLYDYAYDNVYKKFIPVKARYGMKATNAIPDDTGDNHTFEYSSIGNNTETSLKLYVTYDGITYTLMNDNNYDLTVSDSWLSKTISMPDGVVGWKIDVTSPYATVDVHAIEEVEINGEGQDVQDGLDTTRTLVEQDGVATAKIENTVKLNVVGGNNTSSGFNDDINPEGYVDSSTGKTYIVSVERNSNITKSANAATRIVNAGQEYVSIQWDINVSETIKRDTTVEAKEQLGGHFYDYLPIGATLKESGDPHEDVQVWDGGSSSSSRRRLNYGDEYTYTVEWDTENNRQKLLINVFATATSGAYSVSYNTLHYFWDINDYGTSWLNSVAYMTGNEDIYHGQSSNGGGSTMQDASLLASWIPQTSDSKYLYAKAWYTLDSLIPSNAGITKKVSTSSTAGYVERGTLNVTKKTGYTPYSYQIRWANSSLERASNIIILDSIENYQNGLNASSNSDVCGWHGELTGFNFSILQDMGVDVKVYITEDDKSTLDFTESATGYNADSTNLITDLTDGATGVNWRLWVPGEDLSGVTAFAVDLRRMTNGDPYILGYNQSFNFVVYMQAPSLSQFNDDSDQQGYIIDSENNTKRYEIDRNPETNNSIFRSYESILDNIYSFGVGTIKNIKSTDGRVSEFYYTQLGNDIEHTYTININDIAHIYPYVQTGTTVVDGHSTPVYGYENDTERSFTADDITFGTMDKIVLTNGTEYIIEHGDTLSWIAYKPSYGFYSHTVVDYRASGNIKIAKRSAEGSHEYIPGIIFNLSGTSFYEDSDIDIDSMTDGDGFLTISNLPRGDYILVEKDTGSDWIKDITEHTISIDAYGNSIVDGIQLVDDIAILNNTATINGIDYVIGVDVIVEDGNVYWRNADGTKGLLIQDNYTIYNNPRVHTDIMLKKVDKFDNKKGLANATFRLVSDPATYYSHTVDRIETSISDGTVLFEDVERGRYKLTETIYPDGYQPIVRTYEVVVDENAEVTITGNDQEYKNGVFVIKNTPFATLKIRKLDNVNRTEALEGVQFTLSTDADTFDNIAVDSSVWTADGDKYTQTGLTLINGVLEFNNLVDGTYVLHEDASDGKHKVDTDDSKRATYTVTVVNSKVTSVIPVNGTDALDVEFLSNSVTQTGDEYDLFNEREYSDEIIIYKQWVGQPMNISTSGFPVFHLTSEEQQYTKKITTINKSMFQTKFPVGTVNFVKLGLSDYSDTTLAAAAGFESVKDNTNAVVSYKLKDDTVSTYNNAEETGEVYMKYDSSTNTCYLWSDSEIIYLPPDCSSLFEGRTALTTLDLRGLSLDKATTTASMFKGCTNLTTITTDDTFSNVTNVTTVSEMFSGDSKLTLINLDDFTTSSSLTNTSSMFLGCTSLTSLSMRSLVTSDVTTMQNMFNGCEKLANITLDKNKFTAADKLTTVKSMFKDCFALTGIDLRGFGACTNLESIEEWFYMSASNNKSKSYIRYIDLSNFSTGTAESTKLRNINNAFFHTGENPGSGTVRSNTGCSVYAKGQWACTSNVTTSDGTYDYFRINMYGKMYKNSNPGTYGGIYYTKGDPKHLDISIQGSVLLTDNSNRVAQGYFCDAASDYYKNTFYPAAYGEAYPTNNNNQSNNVSPRYSMAKSKPILAQASGDDVLDIVQYGYTITDVGTVDSEQIDYDSNTTYPTASNKSIEFYIEYATSNGKTDKVAITDGYEVPETILLTAKTTWYGTIENNKITKYSQDVTYSKQTTATWTDLSTDNDSIWTCTMKVYDSEAEYFIYEDSPIIVNGVKYSSSASIGDNIRVPESTNGVREVTVTNSQGDIGNLKIAKKLTDGTQTNGEYNIIELGGTVESFNFTVTLTDDNDVPVSGHIGGYTFDSNGETTVTVSGNHEVVITGIPVGYKYTVAEVLGNDSKFTSLSTAGSGTIVKNVTAEEDWYNTPKVGSLQLSKVITDYNDTVDSTDTSKFTFGVYLNGLMLNSEYTYVLNGTDNITFESDNTGEAYFNVNLGHGENISIANIPYGATYNIVESSNENYQLTTYTIDNNAAVEGYDTSLVEIDGASTSIVYTNKQNDPPPVPVEHEKVQLSITKNWENENGDISSRPDSITANVFVYRADVVKTSVLDSNNEVIGERIVAKNKIESSLLTDKTFTATLTSNNNWVYTTDDLDRYAYDDNGNIIYEYYYEVQEVPIQGYDSTLVRTETLTDGDDQGDVNVVLTNTKYNTYSLTIGKTVTGNAGDRARTYEFTLIAYKVEYVGLAQQEQHTPISGAFASEGIVDTVVLTSSASGTKFSLSDGEYLTIKNIDRDVVVKVLEKSYLSEGYETSAKYLVGANPISNYTYDEYNSYVNTTFNDYDGTEFVLSDNSAVQYINDKNINVPTGIRVDIVGIVVVGISALGGLLIVNRKKKKSVV